jgi:hypothetical protein
MVVKRSQTAQGHAGEQLHVRGLRMEMRVWENVPRGYHFAPHDCAVDIAGYITKGSGLWLIDGQEYITSAGDSYYLPAGSMYGLTVLTVIHENQLCLFSRGPHRARSGLHRELLLPVREQAARGTRQDQDGQHTGQACAERQG